MIACDKFITGMRRQLSLDPRSRVLRDRKRARTGLDSTVS